MGRSGTTFRELEDLHTGGWRVSITGLTDEFTFEDWKEERVGAHLLGYISNDGEFKRVTTGEAEVLFPNRAEARIEDLPEEQRDSARAALKRRLTDARRNAARAKMADGVRLVALVPPRSESEAKAMADQKSDMPKPQGKLP